MLLQLLSDSASTRNSHDAYQNGKYLISKSPVAVEAECLHGRIQSPLWQAGEEKGVESMCLLPREEGSMQCSRAWRALYQLQAG